MFNALLNNELIEPKPKLTALCPHCKGPVLSKCGNINAWHWAHESADCDPWSEPEGPWHKGWKSEFPKEMTEVSMGPHRADIVSPNGTVIELQHSPISSEEIMKREAFYKDMVWIFDAKDWHIDYSLLRYNNAETRASEIKHITQILELRSPLDYLYYGMDEDSVYITNKYVLNVKNRCADFHFKRLDNGELTTSDYLYSLDNFKSLYEEYLKWILDNPTWTPTGKRPIDGVNKIRFTWKWAHRSLEFSKMPLFFDLGDKIIQVKTMDWDGRVSGYGTLIDRKSLIKSIKES